MKARLLWPALGLALLITATGTWSTASWYYGEQREHDRAEWAEQVAEDQAETIAALTATAQAVADSIRRENAARQKWKVLKRESARAAEFSAVPVPDDVRLLVDGACDKFPAACADSRPDHTD